ncbi:hypothetical protein DRN79_03300 [Methanosarcinales archaeon]|nr:MAG: hypothetical protein DRN79_03300 [Methanosarcinales archaeon]
MNMLSEDAAPCALCDEVRWRPSMTDLDFNDDGVINQTDLEILKSHFNERYSCFVPWDLNADLRCDYRDFYYFAERVPLDHLFRVAAEIPVWNQTNFTIDIRRNGTFILNEYIPPRNATRVITWLRHYTSIEPPKEGDVVCVHYTRDLCKAAFKELGPKSIAWASSGVHAYGIIYTGGDWRDLSNWFIIDPLWQFYGEATNISCAVHETHRIEILLDEGRFGYWAIHLDVDFKRGRVLNPYKAEFRTGSYRE